MFPEIGSKATVKDLPEIDPEWRNADVVVVGMDLRKNAQGELHSKMSRLMVTNAVDQKRDLPLCHLQPR